LISVFKINSPVILVKSCDTERSVSILTLSKISEYNIVQSKYWVKGEIFLGKLKYLKFNMNHVKTLRIISLFFLIGFLPILLLAVIAVRFYEKTDYQSLLASEESAISYLHKNITLDLNKISSDLAFLAHGIELEKIWLGNGIDQEQKERFDRIFHGLCRFSKLYDQVRLLDDNGQEIIRVNFNDGHPSLISSSKLQSKKGRYYFSETLELDNGQIFISPLDLNKEHGQIETPHKPMLRIATPVFDNSGKKRGIILLNYLGKKLLSILSKQDQLTSYNKLMLVNHEGYWLYTDDQEKIFGFMFPDRQDLTIAKVFPKAWQKIKKNDSAQFTNSNGIFTVRTIDPRLTSQQNGKSNIDQRLYGYNKPWKIISYIPTTTLQVRNEQLWQGIVLFICFAGGVIFFGSWVIANNITRRQLAQQEIIQKNERLCKAIKNVEVANNAKGEFLANMSHEIRTPMNGILGMTRLVMGMKLGRKQKDLLSNVLYSAESLLGILNDILDFSKIESGKLSLDSCNFSLETMLDNIISFLAFQAVEKNIYLKNNTNFATVPKYIIADELRMRQILVNLIGNAIKFTKIGGVTLNVEVEKIDNNDFALKFSVTDTGIGIAPDKQKVVFGSFSQADSSTAREFGGTGLGLAISQSLVKMMGGKIAMKSQERRGSTFYFTITVQAGEKEERNHAANVLGSKYNNLRILLVEDNRINQDLAKILLEQDEQHVTVADNGLIALQLLGNEEFDVILMDMQMPQMNGIIATQIFRDCEKGKTGSRAIDKHLEEKIITKYKGKHIPIIAMTANALEKDRQKCFEAGMNDFLTKPFMPENLHNKLNKLSIHINASMVPVDLVSEAKIQDEKQNTNFHSKAFQHLKSIYEIDDSTIEKLLERAYNTITEDLSVLAKTLHDDDLKGIQKTVHSLKGALVSLGCEKLSKQAQDIEFISSIDDSKQQEIVKDFIHQIKALVISK